MFPSLWELVLDLFATNANVVFFLPNVPTEGGGGGGGEYFCV